MKEIKTLQSLRNSLLPSNVTNRMPIDRPTQIQSNNNNSSTGSGGGGHFKTNLVSSIAAINLKSSKENAFPFTLESEMGAAHLAADVKSNDIETKILSLPNPSTSDFEPFKHVSNIESISGSGDLLPSSSDPLKSSPSGDYLSVSPSFGPWSLSFDNKMMFDETTPDEFAPINFLKGISNINYDFISDNSAENSISEDVCGGGASSGDNMQVNRFNTESFSAAATSTSSANNPVKTSDSTSSFNLDEFDPLRCVDVDNIIATTTTTMTAEPLATTSSTPSKPMNISLIETKPTTLIESEDSPNQVLLPSPLKPTATDYKGFSNSKIPTISCNTGDFSSLNSSDLNNQQQS